MIGRHLLHRLRLGIGDIGVDAERQMVGRDAMAGRGEALGVVADDVVAQPAAAQARRDRDVVPAGELDRFLAADDRDPDRRMRLLHRPRPDRDVLVGPELALVGEDLLGPGAGDDVVGLLEARARLRPAARCAPGIRAGCRARSRRSAGRSTGSRASPAPRPAAAARAAAAGCRRSAASASWCAARRPPPSGWASSSARRASSDAR